MYTSVWRRGFWLQAQKMGRWRSGASLTRGSYTHCWDTPVSLRLLKNIMYQIMLPVTTIICVGAVLSVKVVGIAAHCFSLAADGSLRRWSLIDGQQQLCIQEAVPVDSTPSSVFLHLSEELICVYTRTQVLPVTTASTNGTTYTLDSRLVLIFK